VVGGTRGVVLRGSNGSSALGAAVAPLDAGVKKWKKVSKSGD
jgi:hypothetical protein